MFIHPLQFLTHMQQPINLDEKVRQQTDSPTLYDVDTTRSEENIRTSHNTDASDGMYLIYPLSNFSTLLSVSSCHEGATSGTAPASAGHTGQAVQYLYKTGEMDHSHHGLCGGSVQVSDHVSPIPTFVLSVDCSPLTSQIYFPALPTLAQVFHTSTENINLTVTMYMVLQGAGKRHHSRHVDACSSHAQLPCSGERWPTAGEGDPSSWLVWSC